jgi:hypothetical protein
MPAAAKRRAPAKAKPALAAWLPKAAAAELLGVRPRQLERRESQGFIESRREPRKPNESTSRVLYSRADLLALKAGRPNVHARPEREPANGAAPAAQVALQTPGTALAKIASKPNAFDFAGFVAALAQAKAEPKPWLTLDEAAEWSGLSRSYLLECARAGARYVLNQGSSKRASWRFSREGLRAGK